jgi:DegV family protein with EDD domain
MKIITDSSANLPPERAAELGVEVLPLRVNFMGQNYYDGVDIQPRDIFRLYAEHPAEFSTTSQPSVGEFMQLYQKYPTEEILSIHLTSVMSGTYSSADTAARHLPEQAITVVDSRTLGPGMGWMVELAALAARRGWTKERILAAMTRLRDSTMTMVTLGDVRYLVRSGRVSNIRGMVAAVLHIKPLLGIDYMEGRFQSWGQTFSVHKIIAHIAELLHAHFGEQALRLQIIYGDNLPTVEMLRTALRRTLNIFEDPLVVATTVLGAHGGATTLGLAVAPMSEFEELKPLGA